MSLYLPIENGKNISTDINLVCNICGKGDNIFWVNTKGIKPYTYCSHCRVSNCQKTKESIVRCESILIKKENIIYRKEG